MDNEISSRLKEAKKLRIPAKYVLIDDGIENLVEKVSTLVAANLSLEEIFNRYPFMDPTDIAMISKKGLAEVNEFYKLLELDQIRDNIELRFLQTEWTKQYARDFTADMLKLDDIEIIQAELSQYDPLEYSPLDITSTIVLANMEVTSTKEIPKTEDGFEIFDLAKPTLTLPFVRWSSAEYNLFKVYTGKNLENRPDYQKIIPNIAAKESNNSFIFSVWNGEDLSEISGATKESYLKGVYKLENNRLIIKIPSDAKESERSKTRIFTRISETFPLKANTITDTAIAGELYILGSEINELILSDLILNDERFNFYFFMKEVSSSFAVKKKQLKLYFRSSRLLEEGYSAAFSISQLYAKEGELIGDTRLTSGDPYLKIKISSAKSPETVNQFVNILSHLLSYYQDVEAEILATYELYIPGFSQLKTVEPSTKTKSSADSNISRLKQAAPDLFIKDYARKCLRQFQPIIIPDDEVDEWKNKTIMYEGEEIERQVLPFPPENPIWNFVCPDDRYPFPGVKVNKFSNKDLYPGLPCCFVKDQLSEDASSNYNKLYRDGEAREVGKSEFHMMKTDKILTPGRLGSLPANIVALLNLGFDPSGEEDSQGFLRKGVIRSPNSLLHCISLAANDQLYLDSEDKEDYVRKIRTQIGKDSYPGLSRQEMYDFSDFDITTTLKDGDEFLDPNLFYRAIEEAYKVNIFVFSDSLEYPRFKLFYTRSPREDRPVVLIYRTMGSESDNLAYPQCELISYDGEKDLFDRKMYDLLFKAMFTVNTTLTWELVSENGESIDVLTRKNLYSQLNYFQLTGGRATKQFIDEYGKCRGLYLVEGKEEVLLVTPPSQPENLIQSTTISRASYTTVMKLLTDPIAVTKQGDQIDGLWFSVLDLVYGIYVPIIPTNSDELDQLPLGIPNPLGEKGVEIVPRIRKIKRDLDFILQILKWLLAISGLDLKTFLKANVVVDDQVYPDSSQIYDFTTVGRKFPPVDSLKEAIEEMKKRVPSLFWKDKVFIYSDKFFRGIYYLLQMYVKEYVNNKSKIPVTISPKDLTEQDFKSYFSVGLFLNEKDFKAWLATKQKYPKVYKELDISKSLNNEPYLYQAPDGHIYLIQNVIEGNFNRALFVSNLWRTYKVNSGFTSPEIEEDVTDYVIYGISLANTIVPIENRAGESIDFLSILQYNSQSHAAMLRLL